MREKLIRTSAACPAVATEGRRDRASIRLRQRVVGIRVVKNAYRPGSASAAGATRGAAGTLRAGGGRSLRVLFGLDVLEHRVDLPLVPRGV